MSFLSRGATAGALLLAVSVGCVEKVIVQEAPPGAVPDLEDGGLGEDGGTGEPPVDDTLVLDLGEVSTGTDVSFDVPEGALGFNLTAEQDSADFDQQKPIGIDRITDPSGKLVHSTYTPKGGSNPTSYATFDSIASVSVPQGQDVPTNLAGKWKARFGVINGTGKVKVHARVRIQSSGDGEFHGGKLNLHVHVPKGLRIDDSLVDPEDAANDPGLKKRIDAFFGLTETFLGIERGEVTYSEEASSLANLDGFTEIANGFAVSKGEKDGAKVLHVLFTNMISNDGQPFAAGIAPGIPGAASTFGRKVSGIIITTFRSPAEDAKTMFHETGHFFGLNHTTELDGSASDPLTDTPVCNDISEQTLAGCPDVENIMFVTTAFPGPPKVTAQQKRVYRGSPIYEAVTSGTSSTMAYTAPRPLPAFEPTFRVSGSSRLSPVERALSAGSCGLTTIDPAKLVARYGKADAVAQLRAAAADPDLVPWIRGRANLALKQLGANAH